MRQFKLPGELDIWGMVDVTWEDVFVSHGPYDSAVFLTTWKPCMRRTAGYVLQWDGKYLIIAGTDDRTAGSPENCEEINVIPAAYIRRISRRG